MRFNKVLIGLLTLLFMAVAGLALTLEESQAVIPDVPLVFALESGEQPEQIRAWQDSEGAYYVFLPAFAQMDSLLIHPGEECDKAVIDTLEIKTPTSAESLLPGCLYSFSYTSGGSTVESTITFLRSDNLPSLHIDVASGSMDYLHLDKNNKEEGELRLYGVRGELLCTQGISEMKGRGNTSWYPEKKPYNITLSQPRDLLGMGAAENWVLLAEEYNDINIRNKIVYDFADAAGLPCSPDCQWVDLYLNGEYVGLYLLTERLEIHPQRIDIGETGSFLVSMEFESRLVDQKYPYVLTEAGQALRVRYGTSDMASVQAKWQRAENAILSPEGIDPASGMHWRDLIDLDSWARKYLIEECFGNLDAGALSQYYYFDGTDPQGKIMAGPVWDYDFAMDDESVWITGYSNFFVMNRSHVNEDVYTPWFPALYRQEEFYNRVVELYEREFLPLMEHLLSVQLAEYEERIRTSAALDRIRWNAEGESAAGVVDHIRSFLQERMLFLSDLWLSESVYHTVCVDARRNNLWGWFAVRDGQTLPQLPSWEEVGGLGWYNTETGEPFDVTQPICEDMYLSVKKPEAGLPVSALAPVMVLGAVLLMLMLLDGKRTSKTGKDMK